MPRKIDTRFKHLMKLRAEATTDVKNYVEHKWPVGATVRFRLRRLTITGIVQGHRSNIVVVLADRRKRSIPYERIIQHGREL